MIKLLRYYFYLQKGRLEKGFALRFVLIMELAGSLCFFFLHLITAYLISLNFQFPSWSLGDYWLLIATFELITYLAFFFFWRGINWTFNDISKGTFDYILLTPANSRIKSFFRGGSFNNLVAIILSFVFLVYVILKSDFGVSPLSIILYFVLIASGLWFIHCVDVVFMSVNFKYGKIDATKGPIFNFQQAMKFPATSFLSAPILIAVIIFPISLLTTIPVVVYLSKYQDFYLLGIYFGLIIFVTLLSEFCWRRGIKNYTSAS